MFEEANTPLQDYLYALSSAYYNQLDVISEDFLNALRRENSKHHEEYAKNFSKMFQTLTKNYEFAKQALNQIPKAT
jgi:hypothetical protein